MKKIRTGKILAIVSAIMLLVSCFAVVASAAAPKDGQLYPMFLLGDKQSQYSFWYTSAAAGADPLNNATMLETLDKGNMVEYYSDNELDFWIDKKDDGTITKGFVAFAAPADGEYSVKFNAGLWWEGSGTSYAIEVYVGGKLVEGSRKVLTAEGWQVYEFAGIKAREGQMVSIVPCDVKEGEGGFLLSVTKQPLKVTELKLNFVKSVEFQPDTPAPDAPDTSDGVLTAVITLTLCGAAVVLAKKAHR